MKVLALRQIKHDGNVYEKGDSLEVTEDQAERLVLAESAKKPLEAGKLKSKKSKSSKPSKKDASSAAKSDKDNATTVANLVPTTRMTKVKLIGIARARGLELDKTITKAEAMKELKADIKERGDIEVKPKDLKPSDE